MDQMPADLRALYEEVEHIKATSPRAHACYPGLGCFDTNLGAMAHLGTLPTSPDNLGAQLLLYTRQNRDTPQVLNYLDDGSLDASNFDPSLPIKFLTHGFGESGYHYWIQGVKDAYLDREPMNVVAVDWQKGAEGLNYIRASVNTEIVGRMIGSLADLMYKRGADPKKMHLIGFSLGAQVSGHAATWVKHFNFKIGRITGLDPASPLFTDNVNYGDQVHLDPNDADFVDVIHSNAASLLFGGVGAREPLGHVDFYPNGGEHQAGCPNVIVSTISGFFGAAGEDEDAICNHRRAHDYFEESIRHPECPYTGYSCPGGYRDFESGNCFSCGADGTECAHMGDDSVSSRARGSLFLKTRSSPTFCGTQSYLEFRSAGGFDNLITWGEITVEAAGTKITVAGQGSTLVAAQVDNAFEITDFNTEVLTDKLHVTVTYNKSTEGWVTGQDTWRMDHLKVFTDAGNYYFCQRRLPLKSGVPTQIELTTTPCSCPC
jgi:pimeloyl-ACP methyl ester carboxylesterase